MTELNKALAMTDSQYYCEKCDQIFDYNYPGQHRCEQCMTAIQDNNIAEDKTMPTYNTKIGTIIVERREKDYVAMIADRKTQWNCGNSIPEAIGNLLITHFTEGAGQ